MLSRKFSNVANVLAIEYSKFIDFMIESFGLTHLEGLSVVLDALGHVLQGKYKAAKGRAKRKIDEVDSSLLLPSKLLNPRLQDSWAKYLTSSGHDKRYTINSPGGEA
jgi:hypothetical protein